MGYNEGRLDRDTERYETQQKSGEELHNAVYEDLDMLLGEPLEELESIINEVRNRYDHVTYSDVKKLMLMIIKENL